MDQLQVKSYFQYLVNIFPTFQNYEISFASKDHLKILTPSTTKYGKKYLLSMAIKA